MLDYAMLIRLLSPQLPQQGRNMIAMGQLYLMASLLFLCGFIMALVGLYVWLSMRYPMDITILVTAGVMLASSVLMVVGGLLIQRYHRAPAQQMINGIAENASDMVKSIMAELDQPIRENPTLAVSIAALTGFVAARKVL